MLALASGTTVVIIFTLKTIIMVDSINDDEMIIDDEEEECARERGVYSPLIFVTAVTVWLRNTALI